MPDGNGVDVATLGLRVDARPVKEADAALESFIATGERAEKQSRAFGSATDEVARLNERTYREIARAEAQWQAEKADREKAAAAQSAQTAEESARAQVEALERVFREESAEIRLAVASGLLSPTEAEKAGRETARSFNLGLASAVGDARASGGFTGSAGRQALAEVTDSIKDVGAEGRRAGLGLGRLNDAFVTVARQATGTDPVVGKLVDTVGTFAIGTAYMVPVLAGLAAIGFAWQEITRDARTAREEQDEAIRSALEAARIRELGVAGTPADALAASEAAEARIRARLDELRSEISQARRRGDTNTADAKSGQVREQIEELERAEQASKELRQQVFENVKRENDRLADERKRANDEAEKAAGRAIDIEERRARGFERLAAATRAREEQSAAIVADLDRQVAAEERLFAANRQGEAAVESVNRELEREQALRQALAGAVPADVRAITQRVDAIHDLRDARAEEAALREQVQADVASSLEALTGAQERYRNEIERATAAGAEFDAQMVQALQNVGEAFGDVGRAVSGLGGQLVAVKAQFARTKDEISDLLAAGLITEQEARARGAAAAEAYKAGIAAVGAGVASGFIGGAVSAILNSRADRARQVEEARSEFERVLDDYVGELADRSRFEQLTADATGGAQGAFDALLNSLLADLGSRGSFGAKAAQAIRDAIAQGIDQQGLESILGQFGPDGQAILDALQDRLDKIDELRQQEIATIESDLRVRELRALGLNAEADALARQKAEEAALKAALELGGKALADYTRAVQELEEAQRQAEAAERARIEALDRERTTRLDGLDLRGREAALAEDDRGELEAQLAAQRQRQLDRLDDRLSAGEIELDYYNRIVAVLDGEVIQSLQDFDEALAESKRRVDELAAAERFRAEQDQRAIEVELLLAQGRDDEAFRRQQEIRLLQALNDEKDEEYLATLRQLQAQQLANRAADAAARAAAEQARQTEELKRAIDGTLTVIGGPAGLTESIRLDRNRVLRGDFGLSAAAPDFSGGSRPPIRVDQITVVATPDMDVTAIAEEIYDAVVGVAARREQQGGFNRLRGF